MRFEFDKEQFVKIIKRRRLEMKVIALSILSALIVGLIVFGQNNDSDKIVRTIFGFAYCVVVLIISALGAFNLLFEKYNFNKELQAIKEMHEKDCDVERMEQNLRTMKHICPTEHSAVDWFLQTTEIMIHEKSFVEALRMLDDISVYASVKQLEKIASKRDEIHEILERELK